jgi:TetR/AcrR family transcriptional regulator
LTTAKPKPKPSTGASGGERRTAAQRPPTQREVSRAAIERRILVAAESVFADKGYSGATTGEIARRASLPKPNLHYYFKTKEELYQRVLTDIIEDWLGSADQIVPGAEPEAALRAYIRGKIELARAKPLASRVFANEIIHGAPQLKPFLETKLRDWLETKTSVIKGWVDAKKIKPIDPYHLFFVIWASTQTYADFEVQICAVLQRDQLTGADYDLAASQLGSIIVDGLRKP